MIKKPKVSFSLVWLPLVDATFILLFVFITAYAISADNVPPPIILKVDEFFKRSEITPTNINKLKSKIIEEMNGKSEIGKVDKVVVIGHADKTSTNVTDQITFRSGLWKKKFDDQATNFDYSYFRARLVRNLLDTLNQSHKWPMLENAKLLIGASGAEDLSNIEKPYGEENRRITIEFKRR